MSVLMGPPIAELAKADAGVRAILKTGNGPLRFWPYGEAPQDGEPGYGLPYATFQTVRGDPDNFLAGRPKMDTYGEQVDAYGRTVAEARAVAHALRYAFELEGNIISYIGEIPDPTTTLKRYGFIVEFMTPR